MASKESHENTHQKVGLRQGDILKFLLKQTLFLNSVFKKILRKKK
jgi:hypothetical protein